MNVTYKFKNDVKGRVLTCFLCILIMLQGLFPIYAYAAESTVKTIKVGYFAFPGYHEVFEDENGPQGKGYGFDFLQMLRRYTNLNYQYIGYEKSWEDMQQMPITKRYVEMMGGTISVESEKGVGTTVVIELPMELTSADKIKNEVSYKKTDLNGVKVLIAEDNDLNAEIAAYQLEEFGMKVTRALDGQEAVDAFSGNPAGTFNVILMDIMMPRLNGYEATKMIRSMENRSDAGTIPIIAMTANAFAEDIQASLDAGMNAHIAKPLVMEKVIRVISANLN